MIMAGGKGINVSRFETLGIPNTAINIGGFTGKFITDTLQRKKSNSFCPSSRRYLASMSRQADQKQKSTEGPTVEPAQLEELKVILSSSLTTEDTVVFGGFEC